MTGPTRDLFNPVVPVKRLNPLFMDVAQSPRWRAAREMMNAIFSTFNDVDHSFIKEFQTGGFSSRVFELALFAYLEQEDLDLDRSHPAPDFVVRGDRPIAIEVTTTNPAQDAQIDPGPPTVLPDDPDDAELEFIFQLGKAIRRKLIHRDAQGQAYWEKPHVVGLPFVIAVGAFHDRHAQIHAIRPVGEYLYGIRETPSHDHDGQLLITREEIGEHHWAGRTIPSGLFRQPEAAHLAGVLFTNAHTIPMFARIGTEQGLGSPDVALLRFGARFDLDPNASVPVPFSYIVGNPPPGKEETFAQGLHLFINPWAQIPLPPDTLPRATTHELQDDGRVLTTAWSGLNPVVSKTAVISGKGAYALALKQHMAILGLDQPPRSGGDSPASPDPL